jgi:hypothetical protein
MDPVQERQRNEAAFRRMEAALAQNYPPGRFVAIGEGRVVADADRLDALRALLQAQGKDPGQVLVVRVGEEYPETGVILVESGSRDPGTV